MAQHWTLLPCSFKVSFKSSEQLADFEVQLRNVLF